MNTKTKMVLRRRKHGDYGLKETKELLDTLLTKYEGEELVYALFAHNFATVATGRKFVEEGEQQ
jgi:hypothetical protein